MSAELPRISVVLPCHNERDNLCPLITAICTAMDPLDQPYEIVITDDCSTDDSWSILKEIIATNPRVRAQRFVKNAGQSAAVWAGIKAARGEIVVTLDADLQNDPADIPKLVQGLETADCCCGTRVAARAAGDNFVRRLSSRIANSVRNKISGDNVSDAACGFRAFRRKCADRLKFFKGMHRFMATLFRIEGYTVTEVPIRHHPRHAGSSHYGVMNRAFAASYDLLAVRWMKKRMFRFTVGECLPPGNHRPGFK